MAYPSLTDRTDATPRWDPRTVVASVRFRHDNGFDPVAEGKLL